MCIRDSSDVVEILDQTKLPFREKIIATTNYIEIIKAIKQLSIRGAPAIGVAGAFAAYLALKSSRYRQFEKLSKEILFKLKSIESARPTAVNLSWSINRFRRIIISSEETNYKKLVTIFRKEAMAISKEESNVSVMISEVGSKLIKRNSKIITHCNTGSLATTGPGTALGVIKFANTKVKGIKVFATETASRKSKIATALVANAASQLDPVSGPSGLSPGALGGRTGVGGDQLIVGADAKAIQKLDTQGRTFDAVGSAGKGSNKSNSIRLRRHSTKRVGGIISLYMPPNVSVTYNAGYTDEPIGGIAELAENVIAGVTSAEDLNEAIGNVVSETNIKGVDQAARQAILGLINAPFSGARSLYAINQGQIISHLRKTKSKRDGYDELIGEIIFHNKKRIFSINHALFIHQNHQNQSYQVQLLVHQAYFYMHLTLEEARRNNISL